MAEEVRERAAAWPLAPKIVEGEAAKLAAFRSAHAALAASGTVTLELALAGVPTVVAYRLDPLVRPLKRFLQAKSIVLPNLIVEERAVPEFLDGESSPATLAEAVIPLLRDGPERAAQIAAFDRVRRLMAVGEKSPAALAAEAVLATVGARQA
jgi:lipid-A-disaccharide synthase